MLNHYLKECYYNNSTPHFCHINSDLSATKLSLNLSAGITAGTNYIATVLGAVNIICDIANIPEGSSTIAHVPPSVVPTANLNDVPCMFRNIGTGAMEVGRLTITTGGAVTVNMPSGYNEVRANINYIRS